MAGPVIYCSALTTVLFAKVLILNDNRESMKKNMGTPDKLLRAFLAAVIAILYVQQVIDGWIAIVLLLFAGIMLITSFFRTCPIYTLFGWRTCSANKYEQ